MASSPAEWESYACQVDDEPASILINLAYRSERPSGTDTVYYAGLEILEPGDHGMGVEPDVKELWRLEDEISDAAVAKGFTYVGRLRSQGDWQLTFYATSGREPELEALVQGALGDAERGYNIGSKEDPTWSYFDDFLMPDDERWQWIADRNLLANLAKSGDIHTVPRPVDHFLEFRDSASRDAFLIAARERGFSAEPGDQDNGDQDDGDQDEDDQDEGEERHTAELVRTNPVTLEHIHEVVMDLIELAEEHDGDYGGWGAPVEKEATN